MNKLTKQAIVAAAMALGISSVALADDDTKGCSVATLNGVYVFAATGYNIVSGLAQPKAIVEVIDFNGDGTLTVPAATRSVNGTIAESPPGGTGVYAVDVGCTGKLTFTGGPKFDLFIPPNGKEIWMIQTDPNTVLQGTVTRVSH